MNTEFASPNPPFCLETPKQNHQETAAHQKPQEIAKGLSNEKWIRRHRATSSGDTSFALSSTAQRLLRRPGNIPLLGLGPRVTTSWSWEAGVGVGCPNSSFSREKKRRGALTFPPSDWETPPLLIVTTVSSVMYTGLFL